MSLGMPERRYLAALDELERRRVPFTHGAMIRVLGYRSTARSFQLMQALLATGHVAKPDTTMIWGIEVSVDVPLITSKGRRALARAA